MSSLPLTLALEVVLCRLRGVAWTHVEATASGIFRLWFLCPQADPLSASLSTPTNPLSESSRFEMNRDVFKRVKSFCQILLPLRTTLIMFRCFETFPRGSVSLFCWEHCCHMVDYLFFLSAFPHHLLPARLRLSELPLPFSRTHFRSTLGGMLDLSLF